MDRPPFAIIIALASARLLKPERNPVNSPSTPNDNTMSTTSSPEKNIREFPFLNGESKLIYNQLLAGDITSGLIVIEGNMRSGKTFMARHLIHRLFETENPYDQSFHEDEKTQEENMSLNPNRYFYFDNVRPQRKFQKDVPIESTALEVALDHGKLVLLVGERIPLGESLNRRALHITLMRKI
jgi:hypothetical protein